MADTNEVKVETPGFELVEGWQKFYKMWSIWFFGFIAGAPELYNLLDSSGVLNSGAIPKEFVVVLQVLAFLGAMSRLVKQKGWAAIIVKMKEVVEESSKK